VLAVAGIPPFACFWSKFMIVAGALQVPGGLGVGIMVLVLVESLVAFGWMLHVGQKVFFGEQTELARVNSDPPFAMSAALVLHMIGCLVVPLFGIPLVRLIGG
jgi:NADH:ubiquinone oxidoreductase subunit 5 (subunit L)/multisubunit Na+/H+ antiporter MnhA subunit